MLLPPSYPVSASATLCRRGKKHRVLSDLGAVFAALSFREEVSLRQVYPDTGLREMLDYLRPFQYRGVIDLRGRCTRQSNCLVSRGPGFPVDAGVLAGLRGRFRGCAYIWLLSLTTLRPFVISLLEGSLEPAAPRNPSMYERVFLAQLPGLLVNGLGAQRCYRPRTEPGVLAALLASAGAVCTTRRGFFREPGGCGVCGEGSVWRRLVNELAEEGRDNTP